jgi:hypothetical protein
MIRNRARQKEATPVALDEAAIAQTAETYWRTYLPSQYATLDPTQRDEFFRDVATQTMESIEYLTADNLRAVSRPGDSPQLRARREGMARLKAEGEAMAEHVYLPKEPGTEDRDMPTRRVPGVTYID